ncbi:hypothetical protein FIU94_13220 [Sulfitobacter sp. THAF37]|uniref:DUF4112 domain-containing protein n=1 Tax=Sulfitobacter sp. THAF37 TaxID=2587855 RepID=UPI001269273B|nr:DUF4112 domain-containing protein [Sulfitobacter sp. THAF37]QFT59788.1 hypothetical protein FIU94_13220 [Sulfitobacter sp. THAF37]
MEEHAHADELARLRRLATRMDTAFRIPGTGIRFGWDAIIGLLPGVGDTLALAPSAYIIHKSHRLGAPKHLLARMMLNSGIDLVVGSVPLIGDIFDVGWKSKIRNVDLLERHLRDTAARAPRNEDVEGNLSSHHPDLRG